MAAYLQLSKFGDQISILPILYDEFKKTGVRPTIIVCKAYSEIVLELEWITVVVWDGEWDNLAGAIKFAKQLGIEILIPQTHGAGFPIQRRHPSFQLDQWDRCGRLADWGKFPLVLPRRKNEDVKFVPRPPFILYCDHSQSSPFPDKEGLYQSLQDTFPSHSIVRCSSVRLPRLTDLLALMDAADLIVCVESMHAHLSAACPTPVIVLATDTPSAWHGSAFSPRMALHVRYGWYEQRKRELLHVAKKCVNKAQTPKATITQTAKEHGYNPSVMHFGDKLIRTYRYHPTQESWRTELALECDGETFPIRPPDKYAKFSHEDGRLFMLRGKPHLSCTMSRSRRNGETFDPAITGYGELQRRGDAFYLENWVEPKFKNNDGTGTVKNLVFWEHEGRLHCTWQTSPEHLVLELDAQGNVTRNWKTKSPECAFGSYRGGSQHFAYEGNFLRFVHVQMVNKKSDAWWSYFLAAIVFESKPPFRILKVSSQPIISGNEWYVPNCRHWKHRICIPYGAIEQDSGYLVSLGLNDSSCGTVHLKSYDLNL